MKELGFKMLLSVGNAPCQMPTHLWHDNDHLRHFKEKERGMKTVVNMPGKASRYQVNYTTNPTE